MDPVEAVCMASGHSFPGSFRWQARDYLVLAVDHEAFDGCCFILRAITSAMVPGRISQLALPVEIVHLITPDRKTWYVEPCVRAELVYDVTLSRTHTGLPPEQRPLQVPMNYTDAIGPTVLLKEMVMTPFNYQYLWVYPVWNVGRNDWDTLILIPEGIQKCRWFIFREAIFKTYPVPVVWYGFNPNHVLWQDAWQQITQIEGDDLIGPRRMIRVWTIFKKHFAVIQVACAWGVELL